MCDFLVFKVLGLILISTYSGVGWWFWLFWVLGFVVILFWGVCDVCGWYKVVVVVILVLFGIFLVEWVAFWAFYDFGLILFTVYLGLVWRFVCFWFWWFALVLALSG